MHGIAFVSPKGGVGKTTMSHLFALGAAWRRRPVHVMHTDDRDPLDINGRPYVYYDARSEETLKQLVRAMLNADGFCVVDSGGNRADFDSLIASSFDLMIIPVTPNHESIKLAIQHRERLINMGAKRVGFLLNSVSSNANERNRDHLKYFSQLNSEHIIGEAAKVAAVKQLTEPDQPEFMTPPTRVNNLSRSVFRIVEAALK